MGKYIVERWVLEASVWIGVRGAASGVALEVLAGGDSTVTGEDALTKLSAHRM